MNLRRIGFGVVKAISKEITWSEVGMTTIHRVMQIQTLPQLGIPIHLVSGVSRHVAKSQCVPKVGRRRFEHPLMVSKPENIW